MEVTEEGRRPGGFTEALGEHASNPRQPRTSGEPLVALNEDWTVAPCEQRIKAQFEQHTRARALRVIYTLESEAGSEEADRMRSVFLADRMAGHYDWDGKHCRELRTTQAGFVHLLFLLLRRCHPQMTEDKARAILEDNPKGAIAAVGWALGNVGTPATTGANGHRSAD